MTKFLFDGVEITITIYPIVVYSIIAVLGIVSAVAVGIKQYKIINNKVIKIYNHRMFCFIATIFCLAAACALIVTGINATSYEYFIGHGENQSAASLGSAVLLVCYLILAFGAFIYTGVLTGIIRKTLLEKNLY